MRILHLVSRLSRESADAVTDLIAQQREHGHTAVRVEADGGSRRPVMAGESPRIDLVHAHGLDAARAFAAVDDAGRDRPPLVATAHEWLADEPTVDASWQRDALRRVACLTTPSSLGLSLATGIGVRPVDTRVIPYAVYPAPRLTAAEAELDRTLTAWRTQGGDVFCAVGHDVNDTFHGAVMEALAQVTQPRSLLCVLTGPTRRSGRDEAGLVRFDASPTVARAIAARCDYVALPEFDRRRPFALAETWCDGVPVLAGRHPRFADLDASGHGTVFFDAADPADLARALATVRGTTPASRRLLVERGRAQYRLHFAPSAVFDAYEAAYAHAIARAHRDAA